MLKPEYVPQFRRDIKRLRRKHVDLGPLVDVMALVLEDSATSRDELVRRHNAHVLRGRWVGSKECHVANAGDWLLVWMTGNGIAAFQRTGSHHDIFGQ